MGHGYMGGYCADAWGAAVSDMDRHLLARALHTEWRRALIESGCISTLAKE